MRKCKVGGCNNKHKGHGYCDKHLRRFKKYGDPLKRVQYNYGCKIEGCDGKHEAHGYCNKHYLRWKKGTDLYAPDAHAKSDADYIERFMSKLAPPNKNGCRLWTEGVNSDGYGQFRYKGETWKAHKFYYKIVLGRSIPEGKELSHICIKGPNPPKHNNKRCVCCVKPMTRKENFAVDRIGEGHWHCKVPDHLVKRVVSLYESKEPITQEQLVDTLKVMGYNINRVTISDWVRGHSRTDATGK